MKAALLPERGVVKVAGEDARKFLNGLLTTDIAQVTPERAAFAALLTPQGKIMVDMIVAEAPAEDGGGFFLDCPRVIFSENRFPSPIGAEDMLFGIMRPGRTLHESGFIARARRGEGCG